MSYEYFDKSNLNTKQLRSLDRIEIATKTLSSLYTDLTYISFHEHITYEKTEINVKEILQERVKHIDTFIRFKGLHVTYALEDFMFPIDERKLILLIDNLLSNAIKFSKPKGEIHVCLNKNCLSVKDQGIGIAKEDQEKIFKRFETSNGFGVGLDIVNNICKEHHIKIVLESEISKGSEFILYWPKT
jgi:two-component system OmpR family sensor kinase